MTTLSSMWPIQEMVPRRPAVDGLHASGVASGSTISCQEYDPATQGISACPSARSTRERRASGARKSSRSRNVTYLLVERDTPRLRASPIPTDRARAEDLKARIVADLVQEHVERRVRRAVVDDDGIEVRQGLALEAPDAVARVRRFVLPRDHHADDGRRSTDRSSHRAGLLDRRANHRAGVPGPGAIQRRLSCASNAKIARVATATPPTCRTGCSAATAPRRPAPTTTISRTRTGVAKSMTTRALLRSRFRNRFCFDRPLGLEPGRPILEPFIKTVGPTAS